MCVSAWPDTEFFHVITHSGHAAGMNGCGVAQVSDDVLDLAERNEITKRFLAWEEPDALAAIFSDVSAEEFLGFKAGGEEMDVVDEGVADAGSG